MSEEASGGRSSDWTEPTESEWTERPEAGGHSWRPLSEKVHRGAIHPTGPQSDALGSLLGHYRLTELYCLKNGTLCASLQGMGYFSRSAYIRADGRLLFNDETADADPDGLRSERLHLARDGQKLFLGTIAPRQIPAESLIEDSSEVDNTHDRRRPR